MGANTNNPDYPNYVIYYYNLHNINTPDIGYALISRIFFSLGIEYTTFRIVFSVVGILLIHQTVRKFTNGSSYFYLLYLLYPFLLDVVQQRNFMAMAIFIYAIPFLLTEKRVDKFKYILLILLGASIQIIAIIYLPLLVIRKMNRQLLLKIILGLLIITAGFIGLNRTLLISITNYITNTFISPDLRISLNTVIMTRYGYIVFWMMQLTNFLLILWSRRIIIRDSDQLVNERVDKNDLIETNFKMVDLIYWINIYAFLFLPLYVFNSTYARLMRNIFPLNYIVFYLAIIKLNKKTTEKFLFTSIIILYVLFLFLFEIYGPYSVSIVEAIFTKNWLFN